MARFYNIPTTCAVWPRRRRPGTDEANPVSTANSRWGGETFGRIASRPDPGRLRKDAPSDAGPFIVRTSRPVDQSSRRRRATSRPCAQAYPRPRGRRLSRTQRAAVGKQPSPTASGCLNSIPVHRPAGRSGRDPGLVSLLEFLSSGQTTAGLRIYILWRRFDVVRKHARRADERSSEVNCRYPSMKHGRPQKHSRESSDRASMTGGQNRALDPDSDCFIEEVQR
jgi:hypothetical protein